MHRRSPSIVRLLYLYVYLVDNKMQNANGFQRSRRARRRFIANPDVYENISYFVRLIIFIVLLNIRDQCFIFYYGSENINVYFY